MTRSKYAKITAGEMQFIGDLDKTLYDVLLRASNEELSLIMHGGGYAYQQTWGKVLQAMIKRICTERGYDPWSRKSIQHS